MSHHSPERRCTVLVCLLVILVASWFVLVLTPALPDAAGWVESDFSLKESVVVLVGLLVAALLYWDSRRQMHGH